MERVAEYRQLATECHKLSAKLSKPNDKFAVELLASAWEKAAAKCEAQLPKQS